MSDVKAVVVASTRELMIRGVEKLKAQWIKDAQERQENDRD